MAKRLKITCLPNTDSNSATSGSRGMSTKLTSSHSFNHLRPYSSSTHVLSDTFHSFSPPSLFLLFLLPSTAYAFSAIFCPGVNSKTVHSKKVGLATSSSSTAVLLPTAEKKREYTATVVHIYLYRPSCVSSPSFLDITPSESPNNTLKKIKERGRLL